MTDWKTVRTPAGRLSLGLSVLLGVMFMLYPLLVYYGTLYVSTEWLALVLVLAFVGRLLLSQVSGKPKLFAANLYFVAAAGLLLALLSMVGSSSEPMLFYPVVVNGMLLISFSYTLVRPPSAIERIARVRHAELPRSAVTYTRNATIAWVVFFALNGAVSLYTVLATSLEAWALYNGLIAYVLIGCMLLGEFALRTWIQRWQAR